MHVASDEGLYSFRKSPPNQPAGTSTEDETISPSAPVVCGLYVVADPDRVIEMTVKYVNVDCDDGGMMGVCTNRLHQE